MFGFGKRHEKEIEVITQALRDQIIRAAQEYETGLVTKELCDSVFKLIGTPFSSGYLYSFIHMGFSSQGVEVNVDKYLRTILKDVWDEIDLYRRFNSGLELAEMNGDIGKIFKQEFELGMQVGMIDGGKILEKRNGDANKNLYLYLMNSDGSVKSNSSYLRFDADA